MVQTFRRIIEITQLLDTVVDAPVKQVLLLPQVVHIPVVAKRQFPMLSQTMEIPQLHVDKASDVPVLHLVKVPHLPSW